MLVACDTPLPFRFTRHLRATQILRHSEPKRSIIHHVKLRTDLPNMLFINRFKQLMNNVIRVFFCNCLCSSGVGV
ncbi:hypothetical protein BN137_2009 [Cronobacter condimenti 1330]|uniref:Uncharacterized protein n=1 Tax=Cronobacter condimenti 1330 TaxID=1073999 RepID=K8A0D4_9ENTR|nr:hypothetical protein BN137_2009 [Cronobacter condimenti 1330]